MSRARFSATAKHVAGMGVRSESAISLQNLSSLFLTKLARRTYSLKCSLDISAERLFRFMCKGMALMAVAKRQLTKPFEHTIYASTFLLIVWMYVQVKRGGDIGMTKKNTDGLVVAPGFNTTCGKAMT